MTQGVPRSRQPTIKVILVGNSGVGKTCLIASFFNQTVEMQQTTTTVAPAYSCADVVRSDGVHVAVQIWDTAGQERYHSVSKMFYRDTNVALLCFTPSDPKSRDEIPKWVERVRHEAPECTILLVVTKADLLQTEETNTLIEELNGILSSYEADAVYVTSSITRDGVEELFKAVAEYTRGIVPAEAKTTPVQNTQESKSKCCK